MPRTGRGRARSAAWTLRKLPGVVVPDGARQFAMEPD